jgi:hypothetical protein
MAGWGGAKLGASWFWRVKLLDWARAKELGRGERGHAGSAVGRRLEETRATARRFVVCRRLGNGIESSFGEATRASSEAGAGAK